MMPPSAGEIDRMLERDFGLDPYREVRPFTPTERKMLALLEDRGPIRAGDFSAALQIKDHSIYAVVSDLNRVLGDDDRLVVRSGGCYRLVRNSPRSERWGE